MYVIYVLFLNVMIKSQQTSYLFSIINEADEENEKKGRKKTNKMPIANGMCKFTFLLPFFLLCSFLFVVREKITHEHFVLTTSCHLSTHIILVKCAYNNSIQLCVLVCMYVLLTCSVFIVQGRIAHTCIVYSDNFAGQYKKKSD